MFVVQSYVAERSCQSHLLSVESKVCVCVWRWGYRDRILELGQSLGLDDKGLWEAVASPRSQSLIDSFSWRGDLLEGTKSLPCETLGRLSPMVMK